MASDSMPPTLKPTLLNTEPLTGFIVTNDDELMMPYSVPSGEAAMSLKRVEPSLPNVVKFPVSKLMVPKLLLLWLNSTAYAVWPEAGVGTNNIRPINTQIAALRNGPKILSRNQYRAVRRSRRSAG